MVGTMVGTIVVPILQRGKLTHSEVKALPQGHTTNK